MKKWKIAVIFIILICLVVFTIRKKSEYKEPELYIIISTCKRYKHKTLENILPQLKDAGVPEDKIIIVSGGEELNDDTGPIKFVNYQFWELTSLIWLAAQEDHGDYYLMIHDTCKVDTPFWSELQQKFKTMRENKSLGPGARLMENNGGSDMHMGIYQHAYIISKKEELDALKNYDDTDEALIKSKLYGFSIEGKFLRGFPLMYTKEQTNISIEGEKCINTINELGFTKIQQNCGQGNQIILDV
jgi:hypothetical protein